MKYKKCPRCGLNYILLDQNLCRVCLDEIEGRKSIFDEDGYVELVCPYCDKNVLEPDEIMCAQCRAKRSKKNIEP